MYLLVINYTTVIYIERRQEIKSILLSDFMFLSQWTLTHDIEKIGNQE